MIKKFRFYKAMLAEIFETLCTICLYLESDGRTTRNIQFEHMRGHFEALKSFSSILRNALHDKRII